MLNVGFVFQRNNPWSLLPTMLVYQRSSLHFDIPKAENTWNTCDKSITPLEIKSPPRPHLLYNKRISAELLPFTIILWKPKSKWQEPCRSTSWHLLVFSKGDIRGSKRQIPPPCYWIIQQKKKKPNLSALGSFTQYRLQ